MDLAQQAAADAGGLTPSARDRVFSVGAIIAKVLLALTLPFGFAARGFFSETLRFIGLWMLISSANTVASYAVFYARNVLGHGMTWSAEPPLKYRGYAIVGVMLLALSQSRFGLGEYFRLHWGAVLSFLLFAGFWAAMIGITVYAWKRARGGRAVGLQLHAARIVDRSVAKTYEQHYDANWGMRIGISSGELSRRDPQNSLPAGLHVRLSLSDASRGTIVFGAMGSGKTEFLRCCAVDACRQSGALLALSAKPGDAEAIVGVARKYRSLGEVHVISADSESVNLLAGMSPERVGNAFRNLARDPNAPNYWALYGGLMMTAAAQLAWGLASTAVPISDDKGNVKYEIDFAYDLHTIHSIIWGTNELRIAAINAANALIPKLRLADPERSDALTASIAYFSTDFVDLASHAATMTGVKSGVLPYILPLLNGTARRTWSDPDGINICEKLDAGHIVILNPDKVAAAELFSLVANFTIAHLSDLALRRTARSNNDNNPVTCLLDEYGSYANLNSDLPLIETARQARICLVMSSISVKNLSARLGRDGADAIPSAFSNLVCFATGDLETRKLVTGRIGRVRMSDISSSSSTATSSGTRGKTTSNESTSHRISEVPIIDDGHWRSLGVNTSAGYATCIAIVSENSRSLHDLLRVPPSTAVTA